MSDLHAAISRQIRLGTQVAVLGGCLLGSGLALYVFGTNNAELLLDRAAVPIVATCLLASVCALVSAALFLPLELAVALLARVSKLVRRLPPLGFYAASYFVGVLFLHGFFLTGHRYQRDLLAPTGLGVLATLLVLAAVSQLLMLWLWARLARRWSSMRAPSIPRARTLILLLFGFLALGVLSHRYLTADSGSTLPSGNLEQPAKRPDLTVPAAGQDLDSLAALEGARRVVLISIDTLRADHLPFYGYPRDTAPHLANLARDGSVFAQARSQAPWTLPSHASMMTSLYPSANGARFREQARFPIRFSDALDARNITLAELLRSAGFSTTSIASNHFLGPELGLTQGFDSSDCHGAYQADTLVDKAVGWLEKEKSRPFFLFLHFNDVHDYRAPEEYLRQYRNPQYAGGFSGGAFPLRQVMGNRYHDLSAADLEYLAALYDAAIRYVDRELGRLFRWLRDEGLYEETLIVLTSDHGEEFWDHGGTGHGFTLYEEQLRVPLLIKPAATDRSAGHQARVEGNVGVIDIMPTILDYAGLAAPDFLQGISLRSAVGGGALEERTLFAESTNFFNSYAMIQGDTKYIGNRFPTGRFFQLGFLMSSIRVFYKFRDDELYLVGGDGKEQDNVLEERPETVRRMNEKVIAHLKNQTRGDSIRLDPKTVKQLRALGYLN